MMIWKLLLPPARINTTPRNHVMQPTFEQFTEGLKGYEDQWEDLYEDQLRRMAGVRDDTDMHDPSWSGNQNDKPHMTTLHNTSILRLNRETHMEIWDLFTSCTVFDFSGIINGELLVNLIGALPPIAHRMARSMIVRRCATHSSELTALISRFRLLTLTYIIDLFQADSIIRYWPSRHQVRRVRLTRWWSRHDTRQILAQVRGGVVEEVILLLSDSNQTIIRAINPVGEDRLGVGKLCRLTPPEVPPVEWTSTWTILGSTQYLTQRSSDGQSPFDLSRLDPIARARCDGRAIAIITVKKRDIPERPLDRS